MREYAAVTITQMLEEAARVRGEKTLILCNDLQLSYREVHENACRVAMNLAKRGVGKDDKVVLLMGNCVEFVYAFLGLGRIGAVVVPINPMLKLDEITYIASNADAETLITTPAFVPLLSEIKRALPLVQHVFVLGEAAGGAEPFSALLEPVDEVCPIAADRHDAASFIYTSGTTGLPKGVILTHNNYIWNARMLEHLTAMRPEDRFLLVLPLFHVNAQVTSILAPVMAGADVLLMERFSPFAILPMIEKFRVTIMSAVPTIYGLMCRMPNAEKYDVTSIRFFATGAAPLPEEISNDVQRVLKRPLIMGYGLTEATCASAVADPRDPIKWNSTGSPLQYTCIRIVARDGVDVPVGDVGEILISGPTVMKGYYKNPEATAEVLKNGWLRTGDLGRFDQEGYLYVVGRVKDLIIRGGQNVYPQQVEDVISRIESVEECCVVGVDEPRWGQEILAVVKVREGHTLSEERVIEFCRENLAGYKCPKFVRMMDTLPKTATGKVRKIEVAQQFADIAKG